MKSFNYNLLAETLTLTLDCPICNELFTTDELTVPSPNFLAEKASESEKYDEYEIYCPHCDEWCSRVELYTRIDGGYGTIEELDEDYPIEIEEQMPDATDSVDMEDMED